MLPCCVLNDAGPATIDGEEEVEEMFANGKELTVLFSCFIVRRNLTDLIYDALIIYRTWMNS